MCARSMTWNGALKSRPSPARAGLELNTRVSNATGSAAPVNLREAKTCCCLPRFSTSGNLAGAKTRVARWLPLSASIFCCASSTRREAAPICSRCSRTLHRWEQIMAGLGAHQRRQTCTREFALAAYKNASQLAHRSVMPLKMVLATSERRTKASSAECSDSSSRASCGTSCTPNFAHADGATVCPSRPMTSEAQAAPALSAEQIAGAAVLDLSSMFLMRPYRDVGRLEVGPVRLHGAAGHLLADLSLPLRHLRQDRGLGSAGSAVPRQLRWGCLPYLCCSECAVCIVCEA